MVHETFSDLIFAICKPYKDFENMSEQLVYMQTG